MTICVFLHMNNAKKKTCVKLLFFKDSLEYNVSNKTMSCEECEINIMLNLHNSASVIFPLLCSNNIYFFEWILITSLEMFILHDIILSQLMLRATPFIAAKSRLVISLFQIEMNMFRSALTGRNLIQHGMSPSTSEI